MKALTILQPWASLIACGAKKIETRSWKTNFRGPIAIHAAKQLKSEFLNIAGHEPFYTPLHENRKWRMMRDNDTGIWYPPPGCVIALADLIGCVKIIGRTCIGTERYPIAALLENKIEIDGNEIAFGDYTPGRYAWMIENVKMIEPLSATGRQRLWEWNRPEMQDVPGREP